jgi:hypothetical protein
MEQWVLQVQLDHKDHKESQVLKDHKESQVLKDLRV